MNAVSSLIDQTNDKIKQLLELKNVDITNKFHQLATQKYVLLCIKNGKEPQKTKYDDINKYIDVVVGWYERRCRKI